MVCDLGHDLEGCSSGGCRGRVSSGRVDIEDQRVSVVVYGHGLAWCWCHRVGVEAVERGRREEEMRDRARNKRKKQIDRVVNIYTKINVVCINACVGTKARLMLSWL